MIKHDFGAVGSMKIWKISVGVVVCVSVIGIFAGIIDYLKNRHYKHKPYGIYEACMKRILDFICAMLVLLVFWPGYIVIAILVKIKLGSPVLFCQERPGKDEKIFRLYKFRTMTDERDKNGELLPDDMRMTPFGSWLRRSSLDEIPEVFNIVKGDMSLIGPRPLLKQYIPLYSEEQRHRHDVRPGLSGYAQINGRNSISWTQRFKYDVEYVNRITFWGDLKILFQTIEKAFIKREGISSKTCETMEDFDGTN